MAMTRKSLKAMGLTDEQIDSIIEMHTETVDALKEQLATVTEKADKLDGVQKELDDLKASSDGDDFKAKYEQEHNAFEAYKQAAAEKEAKAAKEKAVRAYFKEKSITGDNLAIAMRGARDEIAAVELDGEAIKDTAALDALIGGDFAGLVTTTTTRGAATATPPTNTGTGSTMSKADIMAIKDTATRQQAIADNPALFGL